jgi:hypothetical protein
MSRKTSTVTEREHRAQQAYEELGHRRHEQTVLHVDCAHGHHLAVVVSTSQGLVYAATLRAHSHGREDRPDVPHHADEPHRWFDILEVDGPDAVDALPASCACGERTLSRHIVDGWVVEGQHRVVVD